MSASRWRAALAAALALLVLAGCAGQGTSGVQIVEWQQQQRDELEARGFPAYGPPGG
jgi:outer membrane biogenesis lipoprotein LolB